MLCVLQCHPTLPVLATSGIEHSIKLWSPGGAATPVDPVSCALRTRKNQERIMSGPQVLRSISPRVFQVSGSHVPILIPKQDSGSNWCLQFQDRIVMTHCLWCWLADVCLHTQTCQSSHLTHPAFGRSLLVVPLRLDGSPQVTHMSEGC